MGHTNEEGVLLDGTEKHQGASPKNRKHRLWALRNRNTWGPRRTSNTIIGS